MIMFCVGAGYIGYCVDGSFNFFIIQKRKNEKTLVEKTWMRSVVNSGDAEVKKTINRASRHFISLRFYYNTIKHVTSHKVQQPAVMSRIYATKSINERWSWSGYVTDGYGLRDIRRVSQFKSAAAG